MEIFKAAELVKLNDETAGAYLDAYLDVLHSRIPQELGESYQGQE